MRYRKAIQEAFREVADVLALRGTIGAQVADQTALVEAAAVARDLAQRRYDEGIRNNFV